MALPSAFQRMYQRLQSRYPNDPRIQRAAQQGWNPAEGTTPNPAMPAPGGGYGGGGGFGQYGAGSQATQFGDLLGAQQQVPQGPPPPGRYGTPENSWSNLPFAGGWGPDVPLNPEYDKYYGPGGTGYGQDPNLLAKDDPRYAQFFNPDGTPNPNPPSMTDWMQQTGQRIPGFLKGGGEVGPGGYPHPETDPNLGYGPGQTDPDAAWNARLIDSGKGYHYDPRFPNVKVQPVSAETMAQRRAQEEYISSLPPEQQEEMRRIRPMGGENSPLPGGEVAGEQAAPPPEGAGLPEAAQAPQGGFPWSQPGGQPRKKRRGWGGIFGGIRAAFGGGNDNQREQVPMSSVWEHGQGASAGAANLGGEGSAIGASAPWMRAEGSSDLGQPGMAYGASAPYMYGAGAQAGAQAPRSGGAFSMLRRR